MPAGGGYRRWSARTAWLWLAILAVAAAAAIPAAAATNSSRFSVSVTVAAVCTVPMQLEAGSRGGTPLCSQPSTAPAPIVSPRPSISITRDDATGLITKTVEF